MRRIVDQLRPVDATPSSFSVHRPGNPKNPFGLRRLTISASCSYMPGTSITSFGIAIGNTGSRFGLPSRNSTYSLTVRSSTSGPKGAAPIIRSRYGSVRNAIPGSAPSSGRTFFTIRSRSGPSAPGASKTTLPLAITVRAFVAPAAVNAFCRSVIFTSPRPPTFTARRNATCVTTIQGPPEGGHDELSDATSDTHPATARH